MTAEGHVRLTVEHRTATIELDRSARSNALTLTMLDCLADTLELVSADDNVRAIVLTGSGNNFSSGFDLSLSSQLDPTPLGRSRLLTRHVHRTAKTLNSVEKPTIACMSGSAIGAGLDLALLCDIRLADTSVRLSESYIKIGMVPGAGGAWLLPRLIGTAAALDMLLAGTVVDATRALSLGLVDEVCEPSMLRKRAIELARSLGSHAPVQTAMITRLVRQSRHEDFDTHLQRVAADAALAVSLDDYHEAKAALAEGRPADFRGH